MIKKTYYNDSDYANDTRTRDSWLHISEFKTSSDKLIGNHVSYKLFPFSLEKRVNISPCHSVGKSRDNITTLLFPDSVAPVFFNNEQSTETQALIIPANTAINLYTPKNFSARLVHIDNQGLRMIMGEKAANRVIADLEYLAGAGNALQEYKNLAQIIDKQLDNLNLHRDELDDEQLAKKVIDALTEGITAFNQTNISQPGAAIERLPSTQARHFDLLMHALNLILNDKDSQLSIAKLADIRSVSIRTLEYIFKDFLGLSPKEYMIAIRLNKVHHELKRESNGSRLIRDIIQEFGVVNTGRFAKEYRLFFGRSPSQTLKTAREAKPVIASSVSEIETS